MAKKRGGNDGGGGSNMALILFLVFFILATVVLGVTTYMGYSELDNARSERDKAKDDSKKKENEANWYRFQSRVYRDYIGQPMVTKDDERELLAQEKSQFDKNVGPTYAKDAPGKDDFQNFLGKVKTMPWNAPGEKSPAVTYESRLAEKDKQYGKLAQAADQLRAERDKAREDVKTKEADLEAANADFAKARAKQQKELDDARKKYEDDLQTLRVELAKANKDKNQSLVAKADAEKARDTVERALKGTETKLRSATSANKELKEVGDRLKDENRVLLDKLPSVDPRALEAEALDRKSLEVLKTWRKDWQIVALDRKGTLPYINLGSADGLKPQVTFSIHSVGLGGKLNLTPKGTVEVVRVVGPHLAQARLTSTRDPKIDPILKGDRLFNPTWDPNQRKHVAIAGLVDLGGEGLESSDDFRRLLARQNVIVDAYVDTKGKLPVLKGDVSSKTDYLVLGDSLEAVKHDKARDKDFVRDFDKYKRTLQDKAQANGVTIIPLRRYLDMIGYQPPRVLANNPNYGR